MPKITCKCGHTMYIGLFDENFSYALIPENSLWDIVDSSSENMIFSSENFIDSFNDKSVEIYECPICKRLLIEESPWSNKFNFYVKET